MGFGKDFIPGRKVYPTKAEYKLPLENFIYCSNSECGLAGTGICRTRIGTDQAANCRHCNKRFPAKPNGKQFGGLHFKALQSGAPENPIRKGTGGGGGGRQAGGTDRISALERSLQKMANSVERLALAQSVADGSEWPPLKKGNQGGVIPPGRWGAHRRTEKAEPEPPVVDRTSQAVVTSQADDGLGGKYSPTMDKSSR